MPALHKRNAQGELLYNEAYHQRWSPAARAREIETPLLMLEPEVEYRAQLQLFSALKDHGKPVEMIVYPDEYHIKTQPRHRLNVAERGVAWLRFWLQDFENPHPTDKQQYMRWRKMKSNQPVTPGQTTSSSPARVR